MWQTLVLTEQGFKNANILYILFIYKGKVQEVLVVVCLVDLSSG